MEQTSNDEVDDDQQQSVHTECESEDDDVSQHVSKKMRKN